jgi:hypothetical protein
MARRIRTPALSRPAAHPVTPGPRSRRGIGGLAALAAGLLLIAAPAAHAQYKWKDAQGQLHVSDLPPPRDVPERNILQRPAGSRAAARPAATPPGAASAPATAAAARAPAASPTGAPVDAELQRRRQQQEQQAAQQAQAESQRQAALRADNCQRARNQLALLQSGQRMMRLDAAGQPVVLDDAARQADIQRTEQVIRSDCR